MYQFIEEKDLQAAESAFINFPESMYKYISENLGNHYSYSKLLPEIKFNYKDKNAFLFKVSLKLFIKTRYNSLYWIQYDGKNFYSVWYQTNGGAAVEHSEYIKANDEGLINYLNTIGVISGGQQKYNEYKNLQTALLREQKINQILNEF